MLEWNIASNGRRCLPGTDLQFEWSEIEAAVAEAVLIGYALPETRPRLTDSSGRSTAWWCASGHGVTALTRI